MLVLRCCFLAACFRAFVRGTDLMPLIFIALWNAISVSVLLRFLVGFMVISPHRSDEFGHLPIVR